MRKDKTTVALVITFLVGLGIMLYPSVSDWWNSSRMTRVVQDYDTLVSEMTQEDYSAYLEAAEDYNERLREVGSYTTIADPSRVEGYEDVLDVTGTGVMGYVTIPSIGVELPIYHGTSSSALSAGAGHLEGSSLPIGGESTHAVISAHRGLPSSRLFTDLDQVVEGDTFTVTVLDTVLTYEVDLITIVEPEEVEGLYIEEGQDYCTLLTCTPYGINTERLLVRGHRIANADDSLRVTSEATRVDTLLVAAVIMVPMLLILLVWLLVTTRKKDSKETD